MHAAHERILYERLKAQLRAKQPEVQRLLLPQSLAATPAHLDTLEQHRDWLHRLGFELAASADESRIHINAVPSLLKHAAVAETSATSCTSWANTRRASPSSACRTKSSRVSPATRRCARTTASPFPK